MTVGLNLFLGLFLLAPGLSFFAGIYTASHRKPFRPAPASPGSLMALGLVAVGMLAAHSIAALLFAAMSSACSWWGHCIRVDYDPDAYIALLKVLNDKAAPPTPWAVACLMLTLTTIAAAGYGLGRSVAWAAGKSEHVTGLLYGWAGSILSGATTPAHTISAFVLSTVESNGLFVGYEGALVDLKQNNEGEIKSVTLKECERFLLNLSGGTLDRRSVERDPIPYMIIEGDNIKNIAFNVYVDLDRLETSDLDHLTSEEWESINEAVEAFMQAEDEKTRQIRDQRQTRAPGAA